MGSRSLLPSLRRRSRKSLSVSRTMTGSGLPVREQGWETIMKIGVLVADGFQDSEYFLPKVEIEKAGVTTEVISLTRSPVEIYSFFSRIGLLDVQKVIDEVSPAEYAGVLIPGGAKSPALLAESETVVSFL